MGMDYAAASAYVVKNEFVEKLCPSEYEAFTNFIEAKGLDKWEVAHELNFGDCVDDKDTVERLEELWENLQEAFQKATTVGDSYLELDVEFHCQEDEGSRYDEVDGMFFVVNGVQTFTPAGAMFRNGIGLKRWVVMG